MRLAIRNSRPDRAEDRLLVAGGRRGAANADDEDLGWFQRAARSVCFFAPPTFVAFHRRTPVLVERRCLLVHEKAVRELVSEDGHSPFPSRRPRSSSSVDPDDLTCVADQHLRQGRPRRGGRCQDRARACQGRSPRADRRSTPGSGLLAERAAESP